VRRYDVGHFDVYTGAQFERVVDDQLDFLRRHVGGAQPRAAAAPAARAGAA
jgi:hypothetical protein